MAKRCRRNGKQCRPWSDCSSRSSSWSSLIRVYTVWSDLPVQKLRIITLPVLCLLSDVRVPCPWVFAMLCRICPEESQLPDTAFPRLPVITKHIIWAASWQNQQNDCTPSEDSDQPGHPLRLIRVFPVCMRKHWALNYLLSAQWRLIRLGGCQGWSESSLVHMPCCWFCHEVAQLLV